MKTPSWNKLLLVAVLLSVTGAAFAEDDDDSDIGWIVPANTGAQNFYGSLKLGAGNNDYPDSNQDGSVTNVSSDDKDTVWAATFGYEVTDNIAVQGAHHNFGESTFVGDSSGGPSWEAGPVSALHESDGWELGVMGRWPISDRWYAIGYMGWLWWESKETFVETSATSVLEESGSDFSYALGLEYDAGLTDRIVYRFMGSHHKVGDFGYDVNAASAEIVYRFP